jgi:hypothetical protein
MSFQDILPSGSKLNGVLISLIRMSTALFPTMELTGTERQDVGGGIQWHYSHTKFRENRSNGSDVEIEHACTVIS